MKRTSLIRMALLTLVALTCVPPNTGRADEDHADIVVGYDNVVSPSFIDIEGTPAAGGILLFEADFGPFFSTNQPGFASELDEGFVITEGHRLYLQAINASSFIQGGSGLGYVNFFNPNTNTISAWGEINVLSTEDSSQWILNGVNASGGPVLVQTASNLDGGIHEHVDFDLVANTDTVGAYGVLFSAFTDDGSGNFVAASDNFWIVFNNGMDPEDFDNFAVARFANFSAVPEPGTGLLFCGIVLGSVALRRRRN